MPLDNNETASVAYFGGSSWESPETGTRWPERGEFELPVPISEQPADNMMSGSGTRRSIGIARGLKRLVGLYGQQHSKETFPS